MSSTQNSNLQQQSYEDVEAKEETQETADAHLFIVQAPGLTREQVGANYEAAYRRIRVFGEKIENNKRKRFSVEHIVPENCEADKLKGQFEEGAKITITMPKKKPKEPEPAQEQEAAKQVTSPKSFSDEVESEAAMKNGDEKGISEEKPKSEIESSQRESDEKGSKMPQKDHGDEEMKESVEDSSIPEKAEKGESGIPQKDHQEGKGIPQEDENKNDKNQMKTSEEGKASLQKDQCLAGDKSKEEEREESALVITVESSGLKKTPEKREKETLFQKDQCLAREKSMESERKESAMVIAAESSDYGLKKAPEKEEEKQMVSESSSSIGKGMKDMVANSVTRMANRFSEEDKQKLLCAGAAILVVAVGFYVSFKLRSMTRR